MPTEIQALETMELFSELTPEELEQINSIANPMIVSEAEILARKGATAHNFFIILSGNFMVSFDEGRAITLHDTGDIMGWSTVFTPFRYKGTIVALTPGEVLAMPGEEFLGLILSNTALGDKVMKKINQIASERMSFVQASASEEDF